MADTDTAQYSLAGRDVYGKETHLGTYPTDILALYCPNFYWACITTTPRFLVELQSIAYRLNVYPDDGSAVVGVPLQYPKEHIVDYRGRIRDVTPETTLERIKEIADSSQTLYRMIGSDSLDVVTVFGRTTKNHYPKLKELVRGTHVVNIAQFELPSGRCTGFWMLPDGIRPQDVHGRTVYATDFEGTQQRIVEINLNQ